MSVSITAGTVYWIVLESDETSGDGANYQTWNYTFDTGNGPSYISKDGAVWSLNSNNTHGIISSLIPRPEYFYSSLACYAPAVFGILRVERSVSQENRSW